jgi:Ca-activated chloride channel family protein
VTVSFTWPLALAGLLAVPALLAVYLLQLRRRRKHAVRFSSVALVRAALPKRSAWKRHLPVALFLGGLAGLGVAAARPQMAVSVPLSRTSIILALDVSRSMCATDVAPNRLAVAQDAARRFVSDRAEGTRIGIVAFAGFAEVVVPPTADKRKLLAAIDALTTARGTVIGAATLKAIDAIAAVNPDVAPIGPDVNAGAPAAGGGAPPATAPTSKLPGGSYVPDIVVLLTDGANTRGVDPVTAAEQAVDRHVRVYTIGFGTTNPTSMVCTREQLGGDAIGGDGFGGGGGFGGFGGGGGGGGGQGGRRNFLVIDEATLTQVADMTGGEFYKAEDAEQLKKVFEDLPSQVVLQKKDREVSVAFAAFGVLLAGAAMTLSLLWNRSP